MLPSFRPGQLQPFARATSEDGSTYRHAGVGECSGMTLDRSGYEAAMEVRNVRWIGVSTENYAAMREMLEVVMGLRPNFEDPTTIEFVTREGDEIQLMAPGDPYFDFFREHARGPVPLFASVTFPVCVWKMSGLPPFCWGGNRAARRFVAAWLLVPGRSRLLLVLLPKVFAMVARAAMPTIHTASTIHFRRAVSSPSRCRARAMLLEARPLFRECLDRRRRSPPAALSV